MNKKISFGIFILCLLMFSNCAMFTRYGKLTENANKYYQKGYYDDAFFSAATALTIKSDYQKAQKVYVDSFNNAENQHYKNINELKFKSYKFVEDQVVEEYEKLKKLYDRIKTMPIIMDSKTKTKIVLQSKDIASELENARINAADVHYNEGLSLSKIDNQEKQKNAAKQFKKAIYYIPNYKDSQERYEISRKAGIKRIAIFKFENRTGKYRYNENLTEQITDMVITDILNDQSAMEFLQIISRDELQKVLQEQKFGYSGVVDEKTAVEIGKVMGVSEIVVGKLTSIIYTPPRTTTKSFRNTKNVIVDEEEYVTSEGKKTTKYIYDDVTAYINLYEKFSDCSVAGSFKVIDVKTGEIKYMKTLEGKTEFKCQWGDFSGNEKAVGKYKHLLRKTEKYAPVEDKMVNTALKNLSNSLAKYLIKYAK